ncbi:hypothetical protein Tco_0036304, partial [Tanacetum coccineum]
MIEFLKLFLDQSKKLICHLTLIINLKEEEEEEEEAEEEVEEAEEEDNEEGLFAFQMLFGI